MSTDLNRRQFASSLIAGSVAGTSTDCIFFPIDTLKTRLQAAEGFRKAGGFRHLEKGVVAVVAGSAPAAALFFGAYTLAKTELSGALPGAPDAAVHMAAAIVGEVVESVVRVPTELVKQRMQAGRHASSPAAVRDIVAASGVRGLFRGYASTLARDIPFALIQFPLYESLRQSYAERARRQPTAVEAALAGSAAGAVAAAITTPLDVAKTRIMLSQDHSVRAGCRATGFCARVRVRSRPTLPTAKRADGCARDDSKDLARRRAEAALRRRRAARALDLVWGLLVLRLV